MQKKQYFSYKQLKMMTVWKELKCTKGFLVSKEVLRHEIYHQSKFSLFEGYKNDERRKCFYTNIVCNKTQSLWKIHLRVESYVYTYWQECILDQLLPQHCTFPPCTLWLFFQQICPNLNPIASIRSYLRGFTVISTILNLRKY